MSDSTAIPLVSETRYALNHRRANSACSELFAVLDEVKDPEIPVLSIWDLGILQDVVESPEGVVCVVITPTYSGCPAMAQITADIKEVLTEHGCVDIEIELQLVPAWTTDWLDADARRRLRDYGVAGPDTANCPQCGSAKTRMISEYGSTACKSMLRCEDCLEPFDQFKRF
ncbi:MAG: phenylacetate-CoA oxygenase subunit PaaJ [Pseudomonadales bacterium]|nr:phenylacetate-CoA oxygenase subunit PaaJ [Pseudomonadales bacterium]